MQRRSGRVMLAAWAGVLALATPAAVLAQRRKAPELVDIQKVATLDPSRGFVDDPLALDRDGDRLLYVNADAADLAELRIVDLSGDVEEADAVDISGFTTTPIAVDFAPGGSFFVVSRTAEGKPATGALIDARGEVVREFGPATEVALRPHEGQPAAVLYRRDERGGKVVHEVEVRALDDGRRVGKPGRLVADRHGRVAEHDFEIEYWADDYTRAVGVKGGKWRPAEDKRAPDFEAEYLMPERRFRKRGAIDDPMKHTRKMRILGEHDNQSRFLMVAGDLSKLRFVDEDRGPSDVSLAEPFHHYDPESLQQHRGPGGDMFFSLQIDPVNPDAVARKKADPEYLDLYRLRPGADQAERLGRLLVGGRRDHSWLATEDRWIVQPRHIGFSRGGKKLDVYRVD